MANLIPLHVHSEYSFGKSTIKIQDLVRYAQDNKLPAISVCDYDVMYSILEFYKECKTSKIKPIIGCEIYISNSEDKSQNLILFAKDNIGYKNLMKLVSVAWCDNFDNKPFITFDNLKNYRNGLICISSDIDKRYNNLFKEDYYIELKSNNSEKTNQELLQGAKELDIKTIITNEVFYLKKDDYNFLLKLHDNNYYLKSKEELQLDFSWLDKDTFEQCLLNTESIANKCNVEIKFEIQKPRYAVPNKATSEQYLEKLVIKGLKQRYGEDLSQSITNRAKFELADIKNRDFSDYFLIIWDIIQYAKKHNIPTGTGRGSVGGSLVAYALGITEVDPIKYNLLYERFLNTERCYPYPDIDIDLGIRKRDKIIKYLTKKYGADKVCQIMTIHSIAPNNAIRKIGKALNLSRKEIGRFAMQISHFANISDMIKNDNESEFKKFYENDNKIINSLGEKISFKHWVDTAIKIENLKNSTGTHCAGVIISNEPLNEIMPLQKTENGFICSAYPKVTDEFNLFKLDLLGFKALDIITDTVKLINKNHNINFDISDISTNDKETFEMLSNGDTQGISMFNSEELSLIIKDVKPNSIEDLSALIALYRPAPLSVNRLDEFIENKKSPSYKYPLLEPILKNTYGVIIYQEQIIEIIKTIMGCSLSEADLIRNELNSKVPSAEIKVLQLKELHLKFVENAVKHNIDRTIADLIYLEIALYCSISFNKAHSIAYALISYRMAYLKCHFRDEFLEALNKNKTTY